jgi:hypothetical protein
MIVLLWWLFENHTALAGFVTCVSAGHCPLQHIMPVHDQYWQHTRPTLSLHICNQQLCSQHIPKWQHHMDLLHSAQPSRISTSLVCGSQSKKVTSLKLFACLVMILQRKLRNLWSCCCHIIMDWQWQLFSSWLETIRSSIPDQERSRRYTFPLHVPLHMYDVSQFTFFYYVSQTAKENVLWCSRRN